MEYLSCVPFDGKGKSAGFLNTLTEVREHYNTDRDFIITDLIHGSGRHVNKQDVEREGNIKLSVRYGRNQEKQTVLP